MENNRRRKEKTERIDRKQQRKISMENNFTTIILVAHFNQNALKFTVFSTTNIFDNFLSKKKKTKKTNVY